jgi:predicted Zn-dependent protease
MKIEPPDLFYLSAAVGWMELGNKSEAREELERISDENREHPHVLELKWALAADANDWSSCVKLGEALIRVAPEKEFGWVHRSYALHELGRTREAWDALVPAVEKFPKEFLIPYNLACYAAQMNKLDEARFWLSKAVSLGSAEKVKLMGLKDNDLKPLWPELQML